MKSSLLIPTLFAAAGALWIIFSTTSKSELTSRIAKSKDRASTSIRLAEIGLDSPKDFEKFRLNQKR